MKKIAIGFLLLTSIGLVGCGSDGKSEVSTTDNEVISEEITSPFGNGEEKVRTAEEIDEEYSINRENIVARKQIKKLDESRIDKASILEYSKNATLSANTNKKDRASNKIKTVEKLVLLDDLHHNTSDGVIVDVTLHLLDLWKNGTFMEILTEDEKLELLYVTGYLDLALEGNPFFTSADSVIRNMKLMIEDKLKGKARKIEEYKSNIDKLVDSVRSQLEGL